MNIARCCGVQRTLRTSSLQPPVSNRRALSNGSTRSQDGRARETFSAFRVLRRTSLRNSNSRHDTSTWSFGVSPYGVDEPEQGGKALRMPVHQIRERIQLVDQDDDSPRRGQPPQGLRRRNLATNPRIQFGERGYCPGYSVRLDGEQDRLIFGKLRAETREKGRFAPARLSEQRRYGMLIPHRQRTQPLQLGAFDPLPTRILGPTEECFRDSTERMADGFDVGWRQRPSWWCVSRTVIQSIFRITNG